MAELNKAAAEVMIEAGVRRATDVTGFGLAGHLSEIAAQSGVTAEVDAEADPGFRRRPRMSQERDDLRRGRAEPGIRFAIRRKKRGISAKSLEALVYDPQTSGGLLMCVPAAKAAAVLGG